MAARLFCVPWKMAARISLLELIVIGAGVECRTRRWVRGTFAPGEPVGSAMTYRISWPGAGAAEGEVEWIGERAGGPRKGDVDRELNCIAPAVDRARRGDREVSGDAGAAALSVPMSCGRTKQSELPVRRVQPSIARTLVPLTRALTRGRGTVKSSNAPGRGCRRSRWAKSETPWAPRLNWRPACR